MVRIKNTDLVLHDSEFREYDNIIFDPATLKTYWRLSDSEAADTGFTFENATWRGTFGQISNFQWPWLHPMGFATQETGAKALATIQEWIKGLPLVADLVDNNRITGPFSRTVERQIVVSKQTTQGGQQEPLQEEFSAGRFVERYLIRDKFNDMPESYSKGAFLFELKQARLF